jgi:primosomal protein N' (replication factor Y)
VVGILDADAMLHIPDFRSYERTFQMLSQVAGRAGRRDNQGKVILQTRDPEQPVIRQVVENNYAQLYQEQIEERALFHYPPYYRLIYIYIKHRHLEDVEHIADDMATRLRKVFGNRVLGPDRPPVARVQTLHIRKIVLKIENGAPLATARNYLRQIQQQITSEPAYKSFIIFYDVDPF